MFKTQIFPTAPLTLWQRVCMAIPITFALFGSAEVQAQRQHTIIYTADSVLAPCKVSQPGCVPEGQVIIVTPRYCDTPQPINLFRELESCYTAKSFQNIGGKFVHSGGIHETRSVDTNMMSKVVNLVFLLIVVLMLLAVQGLLGPHPQSQKLKSG